MQIAINDIREIGKFDAFLTLLEQRTLYAKMNGIHWSEYDNARIRDECYRAIYEKNKIATVDRGPGFIFFVSCVCFL